ncbi:AMP-binding protein [Streptomyces sp. 8N114]|uniref:AMP-binding protein n=1 Tax=Streptomyces sp. 8N114 TaxID=3457419 RepID=UPI003FD00973
MRTSTRPAVHPDRLDWRPDPTPARPTAKRNLAAALMDRAAREPDAVAYYLPEEPEEAERMTVGVLYERAHAAGAALSAAGVGRGDRVIMCLDTSAELVAALYGAALVGAVPILAEPPLTVGRRKLWLDRVTHMVRVTGPKAVVCDELLRETAHETLTPRGLSVVCPPFAPGSVAEPAVDAAPEELALIQFSSGTTSAAKGIMLSHRGLLAAARSIGEGIPYRRGDIMISWLPLHHDMGMVGGLLSTFLHDLPSALMRPLSFATRPQTWLRAIHRYRGTVSPAPNFAYRLVASTAHRMDLAGLDLSSWRSAFNGAEVVEAGTLRDFTRAMRPHGFRAESMRPCYGMAELGLAATFAPAGSLPRIEVLSRTAMADRGVAAPPVSDQDAQSYVSSGIPVPGIRVRITDPEGREVPEGHAGSVLVASESMMAGYYGMPERTAEDLRDGWLTTGDLGFMLGGELFVTGRSKDLVIIAGGNYQPQPLELAATTVEGVRPGGVAAVGVLDPEQGTERLVMAVESRLHSDPEEAALLGKRVELAVSKATGLRPSEVVVVPRKTLPRTPSGKAQRPLLARMLAEGTLP